MKKRTYKGREVSIVKTDNVSLIKQTNKLIDEANRRIITLLKGKDINKGKYNPKTKRYERASDIKEYIRYSTSSWATKKLYDRLFIDKGLIPRLKKNDSYMKIISTNKAIRNYLSSQTSTIEGIKKVEETTKNSIRNITSNFDTEDLSPKEINTLYNYLSDPDFNYATQYFDPSDLWINLAETKSAGGNEDDFLRKVENLLYSDSLYKDEDLVDALTNIYNKYKNK